MRTLICRTYVAPTLRRALWNQAHARLKAGPTQTKTEFSHTLKEDHVALVDAPALLLASKTSTKWRPRLNLSALGFSFCTRITAALAIQGPGMIVSIWPDWVILLYIIGVELTVE
jgi:hypothetical protein